MAAPIAASEKSKLPKILITVLILILLMCTLVFGYIAFNGNSFFDITKLLNTSKEETILLNEFVLNLKSDSNKKNYLKIQIALMYNDKKDGELIESNVNKIRDTIINNLLDKTSADIIDGDNIHNIKEEIKQNINLALYSEVVKDIYITDIVIQ